MSARVLTPTPVNEPATKGVLSDAQVSSWRNAGFTLVDGVFSAGLIGELQTDALQRFPAANSAAAETINDFGSEGGFVFPSTSMAFNAVTLHPKLLAAVAQLLAVAVSDLRLTQSDLWPKYGNSTTDRTAFNNQDQRIHVDYPNHLLAHPTPWHRPEAVEAILYLSDVDDCGGATAVVAREGDDDPAYPWPIIDTPGVGELDYVNDKASAEAYLQKARPEAVALREQLYAREQYVSYRPGTLLLYRHDTWHRGTPMLPGALRMAHNLSFRRAECEWISTVHTGWAWSLYEQQKTLAKLIATASLDQRAVLGFPQPGSSYWCDQTVAAVHARYGMYGMDMTPYRSVSPSSP